MGTGGLVGGIDLRSGRFRNNVANDDDLRRIITNGIQGPSMPDRKLAPAELTAVVAYVRDMRDFNTTVVKLGDSARGRNAVEGSGWGSCHHVGTTSSRIASDLSEIDSSRSPAAIQQALLDPSRMMMPINPVRLVTKEGRTINGRRLNEDNVQDPAADRSGRPPDRAEGRSERVHDSQNGVDAVVRRSKTSSIRSNWPMSSRILRRSV
jgi:hypothetical protein